MKYLLVLSCLIGSLVAAEKQIKLEDIERDNLASEKKAAQERGRPAQHLPPAAGYLPQHHLQAPQQYNLAAPQRAYQPPSSPANVFTPQQLASYITSNHLPLQHLYHRQHLQLPQYTTQHQLPHQQQQQFQSHLAQFYTQPQHQHPHHHHSQQQQQQQLQQPLPQQQQQQQQYIYVQPIPGYGMQNKGGVQYVMYLQPAAAASYLQPQTSLPTNNYIQLMQQLAQNFAIQPQLYHIPEEHYTQPQSQAATQQHSAHSAQVLLPQQPQAKFVVQPEVGFIPMSPKHQQQSEVVYVPQEQQYSQAGLKGEPKSLLDSYVPSVLQIQYLKAQQLKAAQQLKVAQQQQQQQQQQQHSVAGVNAIEYTGAKEYVPAKAASSKTLSYQSYFPTQIQHGGGSTSYVNYRLGRYAQ